VREGTTAVVSAKVLIPQVQSLARERVDALLARIWQHRVGLVVAPAGSGKTELLIQRYLALLSRVERPEAIVAMTFTRKAAGEIRERVVAALRAAASDAPPAEAHAALTWRLARTALRRDAMLEWNLIAHPARLQVQTLDALCASLMGRAPLTLKVGTLPRFVDRGMPLYLEAARFELDAAGVDNVAWRRLLDHLDNDADRLVQLIAGMLAKRDQWLNFVVVDDKEAMRVNLEKALVAEIDRELNALDAVFPREVVTPLLELARHAGANLQVGQPDHPLAKWPEGNALPPPSVDGLPQWLSIAEWLLKVDGTFREKIDKRQGFLAPSSASASERGNRVDQKQAMGELLARLEQVPGLVAALHSVRALPPPRYDQASWSFIAALLDVLRHAVARLQLVFAQENAIDYPESTLIALRALSSADGPSELLLALDMRIEHLLLDEFQDTSLAQHQLIERLTEGWTPGDGRSLFVVGGYYRLDENWGLGIQEQYEATTRTLEEQRYSIYRDLTSWVASFGAVVRDNAGVKEYGVLFTITLKAFPKFGFDLNFDPAGAGQGAGQGQ